MTLLLLYTKAGAHLRSGALSPGAFVTGSSAVVYAETGTLAADTSLSGERSASIPVAPAAARKYTPDVTYQVAFASPPLSDKPAWIDLSERLRGTGGVETTRGRSYEFNRMETGTSGALLSNRDAALSPENSASPYHQIRSTRPVRILLDWVTPYPLFRGITEGFPQTYPSQGKDATVQIRANDLFYGLNNSRFIPGATTLTDALAQSPASTSETISVGSTALPMPQVAPFTITIAGDDPLTSEDVEVTEILSATSYQVTRSASQTWAHSGGVAVTTNAVSFGEAMSGERIRQVLERVGFEAAWYDLDTGQSLIAPSGDLALVNPLEHINLITDAEFGRFFVSREGRFTFRDRHSIILDYTSSSFTFHEPATGSEVPFALAGELSHSEEKLYNRVKITITGGDYDAEVIDVSDEASIDQHFERIFERAFPYANRNDAESAAIYVLTRYSEAQLRLPGIVVRPASDPATLWPLVLAREIGDRVTFRYQPIGGGDEINVDMAIDGIAHAVRPGDHQVTFQCTEVDSTDYWILGDSVLSELDATTRVGF